MEKNRTPFPIAPKEEHNDKDYMWTPFQEFEKQINEEIEDLDVISLYPVGFFDGLYVLYSTSSGIQSPTSPPS